jgi:hypothetical protein
MAEAADAVGIGERVLKSRLHRGRMALDAYFQRQPEGVKAAERVLNPRTPLHDHTCARCDQLAMEGVKPWTRTQEIICTNTAARRLAERSGSERRSPASRPS